ncbi:centromere protein S [Alosa pseudoharengus]|uniref:centromere protein S n=1 Tax=Alosa sapidissima TaxID=34773 RepID=UPI001C08732C|nr:centromere protein S [Alosa sapidissima]
MDDTLAQNQRLKAAIHFTTGQICQTIAADCGSEFSRQTIAAIAETTYRQCDIFAKDLESFARHAKRSTINVDDVKLVSRRSTALSTYIQQKSEELASAHQEQKEKRKKSSAKRKHQETEDDED